MPFTYEEMGTTDVHNYGTMTENNYHKFALISSKGRRPSSWIKQRYVLVFITFLGLVVDYSLRVTLSVTLVAMVNNSALANNSSETYIEECPADDNTTKPKYEQDGEFVWDENIQGLILGAFFYGYVATQIPGGILAEKYGGKWLFGGGLLIPALLTLITPLAARLHYHALIVVRVLEGIGEGVTIPAMYAIFTQWSPRQEKSTLLALACMGVHVGTIFTLPLSGLLCESDILGGWPLVFYIFGAFGCLWFVLWSLLITNTPETHPWISQQELTYIVENRQSSGQLEKPVPWKSILTSAPVWSLGITKFCAAWGFYTLLTDLPTYLKMSLHVPPSLNGILNSLLYVAECISVFIGGCASDLIRVRGYLTPTATRKVFEITALIGPAICLSLIPQVGCDHLSAICLLVTASAMHGLAAGGETPNPVDLAPDFAGAVMGFVNALGNASGILAPLAAGKITLHHNNMERWSKVFYLSSGIYFCGAIVFFIFGSGNVQPWGTYSQTSSKIVNHLEDDSVNPGESEKILPKNTKS